MKSALEINREYSEKFIQPIDNPEITEDIKELIDDNNVKNIVDLGCGDGTLIYAIKKAYSKMKITGIDISPRRINNLKSKFPKSKFYCRDVCQTKLKKESFDFVHSSQTIEHVEDDKKMVEEMYRLLKKEGILLVSSVIKKPFAVYKYINRHKKFALDPTHEKEYKNEKEFLDLFKERFKLIKYKVDSVRRNVFGIQIRIPGFYLIEGIWKK